MMFIEGTSGGGGASFGNSSGLLRVELNLLPPASDIELFLYLPFFSALCKARNAGAPSRNA
jgi:hypothetical protein